MTESQPRAKAGGEIGANGEWYEGGKFIATTQHEKGQPKKKRFAGRKQEIEPYKWEVAPAEGLVAIFRQLAGLEFFNRQLNRFAFNPALRGEMFGTAKAISRRESLIAKYNAGERWA